MLIRVSVHLAQRLPHHGELRLAVSLEDLGIALPKHLGDEMIRYAPPALSLVAKV